MFNEKLEQEFEVVVAEALKNLRRQCEQKAIKAKAIELLTSAAIKTFTVMKLQKHYVNYILIWLFYLRLASLCEPFFLTGRCRTFCLATTRVLFLREFTKILHTFYILNFC